VIQSDAMLAERLVRCRRRVLVQTEQGVAEEVRDGVMEPRVGVLVEYRLGVRAAPRTKGRSLQDRGTVNATCVIGGNAAIVEAPLS
jgi:hypothetical protein